MSYRMAQTEPKRMTGRALQARRERKRQENPLCWMCLEQGRTRAWTQLDHKVALANGGEDTDANTAGLCDDCHEIKTAKDLGHKQRPRIGTDGWPT